MENARLAGRNPPAPGRTAHHLREHGRRRRDVRRRRSVWSRGTASSRRSSTCPTTSLGRAPDLRGIHPLSSPSAASLARTSTRRLAHRHGAYATRNYAFERTRPDGRVIEIRRNPVPDGGFVLIYSDITERKRNEAEIRAARDAAESRLSRPESRPGQPDPGGEDGVARPTHRRHRARDQEPAELRQQLRRLSVDLLDELKETAAPGFAALTRTQRAEVDESDEHADQQSGEDHRARQTRRRHREGDAGTFARVIGERRRSI